MLRSDEVPKDLAGLGHTTRSPESYGEGLYDERTTAMTYDALLERARSLLELGEPVILDASWSRARWRDKARAVASATSSDLVELRCDAPVEVARERLVARALAGVDVSDATSESAARMAGDADPWPTATTIDTSSRREEAVIACYRDELTC